MRIHLPYYKSSLGINQHFSVYPASRRQLLYMMPRETEEMRLVSGDWICTDLPFLARQLQCGLSSQQATGKR